MTTTQPSSRLLPILQLLVNNQKVNIALDRCSTMSYIIESMVDHLGATRVGFCTNKINVVGGSRVSKGSIAHFKINLRNGDQVKVQGQVVPKILPDLETDKYKEAVKAVRIKYPELDLPNFESKTMEVHVLLAGDVANELSGKEVYKVGKKLEVRSSLVGPFYIQGSLDDKQNTQVSSGGNITLLTASNWTEKECDKIMLLQDVDERMNSIIEGVFNQREFQKGEDEDLSKEDIISRFEENIKVKEKDGVLEYEVALPWKNSDSRTQIPENFRQTLAMSKSNASRMKRLGVLGLFHQSILDHVKEGIFKRVDISENSSRKYVPSFGVLNPKSSSTPVRLVVAANLPRNNSVNDQLANSLNLLLPLDMLVHRWRVHEVGVTADVSRAYYRIFLSPLDRGCFTILWFEEPEEQKGMMALELQRLPMGSGPSQAIMLLVFNYHLKNDKDQEASQHLMDCLYSDNAVTSLPADIDTGSFCKRMHAAMARGGFTLKKFSTNNDELREQLRAESLYNEAEVEVAQVLGLKWFCLDKDLIGFNSPTVPEGSLTKRKILSFCHQGFDGLSGILCGILIKGTSYFSEICPQYDWDSELSEDHVAAWVPIQHDIIRATKVTFPRWYQIDVNKPTRLHVFCDAAQRKYLACLAFLEQDGHSVLVAGKAKIPPKNLREKEDTVPKLELEALVLAARMLDKLLEALSPHYTQIVALIHSDATIALTWLVQESALNRFVHNRVKRFHQLVQGRADLFHCTTDENVADYPSRGMSIESFMDHRHPYWTGGSVVHDYTRKPFQAAAGSPSKEGELVLACTTEEEQPRPSALQLFKWGTDPLTGKRTPVSRLNGRVLSLSQVTRVLACVIKFLRRYRKQPELGGRELSKNAMVLLIKGEQTETIADIVQYLKTKKGAKHSWIHSMSLWVDKQGLVRLGGRLGRSGLNFGQRYPILYPHTSPLWTLRIQEYHLRNHCGVKTVKHILQRQFWTPAIGRAIEVVIKDCYNCKKATGVPYRPPGPPQLAAARVIPDSYSTIGVDYTGSFSVRSSPGSKETIPVYLLLISCVATRHFMAYVVTDLSTETFLHQLRRHAAVVGSSHTIYSDRAANFLAAADVLGKKLADEWVSELGEKLGRKGVTWKPNTSSYSPHQSGHIEALVKVLKTGLKRSLGRRLVDIEEFRTLVSEAVCICNDRPLIADLSPDHRDRLPITPNKLLLGKSISPLPYGEDCLEDLEDPSYIPKERELGQVWKSLAKKLDIFKTHFAQDWLMTLRARHIQDFVRDPATAADIEVGDLCVVSGKDHVKRSLWSLGIVERILPSSDAKARAVEIRVSSGLITRPLERVCLVIKGNKLKGKENAGPSADNGTGQPVVEIRPVDQSRPERPTRAAKTRGRERVKGWCEELNEENLL